MEFYVKLHSVISFLVRTPKKYHLHFYRENSTAKIKLIFFKQFTLYTFCRYHFTVNNISNVEFEFFSCRLSFGFSRLTEYFLKQIAKQHEVNFILLRTIFYLKASK